MTDSPFPRRSPRLARPATVLGLSKNSSVERRLQFSNTDNLSIPSQHAQSIGSALVPSSVDVRSYGPPSANTQENRITREITTPALPTPNASNPVVRTSLGSSRGSPGGAVQIRERQDRDEEIRASRADEMSAAYSFLSSLNIRQIRDVLKEWRWKQSGNKRVLVARAFLQIQIFILSGKTLPEAMATHGGTQRFESWFSHKVTLDNRSPLYLSRAPSQSSLFDLLEVREVENFKRKRLRLSRGTDGSELNEDRGSRADNNRGGSLAENHATGNAPASDVNIFSINEFARLCIIMRDDEDAKAALVGTGQELTRSQLDAGFTRDSYWGVIESRFNDTTLRLHLNMVGSVDNVDSTLSPPCHRSASFLKDKFLEARRSYTTKISNWSQSGQNDNTDFKRFAGTRNGKLTAEGKRNMVLFVCSRKGTDNEDTRFSNLCSRIIPFGRGCDEGGGDTTESSTGRRRRNSKDTESAFEKSWRTYSEVATAEKRAKVAERLERAEKRKRMEKQNSRKEYLQTRQWAVLSMGDLYGSMRNQGLATDESYKECANLQMAEMRKVFMMPQPQAMGLPPDIPQSSDERNTSNDASGRALHAEERGNQGVENNEDEIQPVS